MFKRQNKPQAMLLGAMWAMFVSIATPVSAAGPSKGENRGPFGLLCAVVLAESEISVSPTLEQASKEAAQNARFMSLIIEQPAAISKVASLITEAKPNPDDNDAIPKPCKQEKLARCTAAAKYFKALPDGEKQKLLQAAADGRGFKQVINKTLTDLINVADSTKSFSETEGQDTVKGHLIPAIYGQNQQPGKPKLLGTATTAQAHCGSGDAAAGSSAAKSIAATIACLCTTTTSGSLTNTGCYGTPTGNQNFGNQNEEVADWATILANCKAAVGDATKQHRQRLGETAAALRPELYTVKASTGKSGIIGHIEGQGTGDGNAENGGHTGACASFRTGPADIAPPEWLGKLATAVEQQTARHGKQAAITRLQAQIHTLNNSLTTLLALSSMEALKRPTTSPATAAETASGDSTKHEESEEKCNKKEKDTDCTAPCTWDGEAKPPKKKCTLSEDAKKQVEKANQETKGKDGKPDCSSHQDQTACEKENTPGQAPVCGWRKGKEGETDQDKEKCRNGSFLATKKFALSVVSAAFAALLF
uniref:Variant surface glycoprotein n=1 Tax=Trypanosoma brucei TaxID=5691 RepID=A0A1V0G0E9_9TRYP|nr:variant surface glycoprotein [Trypanosoma brucei]